MTEPIDDEREDKPKSTPPTPEEIAKAAAEIRKEWPDGLCCGDRSPRYYGTEEVRKRARLRMRRRKSSSHAD